MFTLSLQFAPVQTFVTKKITKYLSEELNAEITLSGFYFKPFSALTIHDLQINDTNGVPIFISKRIHVDVVLTQLLNNKIVVEQIKLTNTFASYEIYQDSSNFQFLMEYFTPKKKDGPKKKQMEFALHRIELANNHFRMINHTKEHLEQGVDFSDLELLEFSGILNKIQLDSNEKRVEIQNLTFKEKSGFHLKNLTTEAVFANKYMQFDHLDLQTNRSTLKEHLRFDYESFDDFSDFIRKVRITSEMRGAFVDSRDIEFFAPSMNKVRFTTEITQASLQGTVADISAKKVIFSTAKSTNLTGDFTIKGLPDIDKTIFNFHSTQLTTTPEDIEYLVPQLSNRSAMNLPDQLHTLGHIIFNGEFKGFYNNFNVNGNFVTDIGNFYTESKIDIRQMIAYEGILRSESLDIGAFLHSQTLEKSGVNLSFSGKGIDLDNLSLTATGNLQNFHLQQRSIQSISFQGNINQRLLQVHGDISDPSALLTYDALVDWSSSSPVYTLNSTIDHLNLKALNLIKKDSIIIHHTSLKTNLMGDDINNLTGYLTTEKINLETQKGEFVINDFHFEAEGDQHDRELKLTSSVMDFEMTGIIDLNTITAYFQSLAMRYAPAIALEIKPFNPQNFDLRVSIRSFEPVSTFLDPSLTLDDGAYLTANFSSDDYLAEFTAFSPNVTYKGMRLQNLTIYEKADDQAFSLDVIADRLHLSDSIFVKDILIQNVLSSDSLLFKVAVENDTAINHLRLNGNIHFAHNKPAYIHFDESTIMINQESWQVNTDSEMRVSKGKFFLENLKFWKGNQSVSVNGILSNEPDELVVDFNRFGLESLEAVTKPLGVSLRGELNGKIAITSIFNSPNFQANINTTPIVYNNLPIGQLVFIADYKPDSDLADISLSLSDEMNRGLKLEGTYNVANENDMLHLNGTLKEADLIIAQPFLRTLITNLQGKVSGDFKISGNFNHPIITGTTKFQQTAFTVIYLNTPYILDDQTTMLDKNLVMFNNLRIRDHKNHEALANGYLDLNQLSNPNVDVDVRANNFMVLNTTYKENNLYYGTAYATGTFRFKGKTSSMNIDIDAASNANTVIYIPFNSAMTVSDSDFIYFVDKDSSKTQKRTNQYFLEGLTMNMDIKVTPEAELNLQTDIGSLKGTGIGEVTMKVSSLGDFEMFGDYAVNSGKFHFTAQDFINKYFDIKQGGTIRWSGNPSDAIINLTAIYQQRTSIGALYNSAGRPGQDERVLAQADMIITGTLTQPDISFDLNFPLNPYVKDELQAYLSDANNVNQQALSLIVRRSFSASSSNEFGREVNNTLLSAGTEIAFNQLNTILSQSLNINFLDLNIRSFNDASASLRFFDDRLILTGGISDRRNLQTTDLTFFSNQVATDAELTYRIRRDGSLMFRAYNRLNTRNILFTPTDDYINAVGLVYRREFNTFEEFLRRMWTWKRKEESSTLQQKPTSSTKEH